MALVEQYMKVHFLVLNFVCHLSIMSCSCEKRYSVPGSPHFYILQAPKSWAGPGDKATTLVYSNVKFCVYSTYVHWSIRCGWQLSWSLISRAATATTCTHARGRRGMGSGGRGETGWEKARREGGGKSKSNLIDAPKFIAQDL